MESIVEDLRSCEIDLNRESGDVSSVCIDDFLKEPSLNKYLILSICLQLRLKKLTEEILKSFLRDKCILDVYEMFIQGPVVDANEDDSNIEALECLYSNYYPGSQSKFSTGEYYSLLQKALECERYDIVAWLESLGNE